MPGVHSFKTCKNCGHVRRAAGKGCCSQKCAKELRYKTKIQKWLAGELSGTRGKTATAAWIKKYILEIRGHQCECCKNSTWMGKPIPLDLEHIDGDFLNNHISNLQLLCLNCHGQTPTYKSKNRIGRPRAKYYRGT